MLNSNRMHSASPKKISPVTLTNYASGELLISSTDGPSLRLDREAANRLIMHARMHTVAEFIEGLSQLIEHPEIVRSLGKAFDGAQNPSDRWNLKEKIARLHTLARGYPSGDPGAVIERIDM